MTPRVEGVNIFVDLKPIHGPRVRSCDLVVELLVHWLHETLTLLQYSKLLLGVF